MPTWGELIAASPLPHMESRLLAAHAAGRGVVWMIAHDTDEVPGELAEKACSFLHRRESGEPVAYITGEREFFGLPLHITPDVLIPRPETELLVELAVEKLCEGGHLLDIGTGSGAIVIAVARHRPDVQIVASDISAAALAVAQANCQRHQVNVRLVESDGLKVFSDELFDVIVSNPPYIAEGDPHLEQGDLRFEPRIALSSGHDGLGLIKRLVTESWDKLRPGGWLLFEHGYNQGELCQTLFQQAGYGNVADRPDLAGIPRVCLGQKPAD